VLGNAARSHWFVEHGMPPTPPVTHLNGGYLVTPAATDPVFAAWVHKHGTSTYARSVLTHPGYTLLGPLPYLSGEQASLRVPPTGIPTQPDPTPSLLSPDANYGRHRELLPIVVQQLMFQQGQIGDVVALAIGAFALLYLAWRRHGWDSAVTVPLLVAATALPQAYVLWLSDAVELDRIAVVLAVSLRIAL